jgi:hypothetical protein
VADSAGGSGDALLLEQPRERQRPDAERAGAQEGPPPGNVGAMLRGRGLKHVGITRTAGHST